MATLNYNTPVNVTSGGWLWVAPDDSNTAVASAGFLTTTLKNDASTTGGSKPKSFGGKPNIVISIWLMAGGAYGTKQSMERPYCVQVLH